MRLCVVGILAVGLTSLTLPTVFAAELSVTPEHAQASRASYVTPDTVHSWLEKDRPVTFLDVREADEFTAGHLPGAINIHFDQVASRADQLSREHPIVIYCIHSAHRAPEAAKSLQALGFDNVSVLEGGIVAWQAEGLSLRAIDLAQLPKILPKTERCSAAVQP